MTPKENIKSAYPHAYVKILTNPETSKNQIFIIMQGKSTKTVFGVGSTEEKAWESAWKMTQKKMLKIFESGKI